MVFFSAENWKIPPFEQKLQSLNCLKSKSYLYDGNKPRN